MVISSQPDGYSKYAKGTPQAHYDAADYARLFIHLNSADKKPFLFNAISPLGVGNTYQTIVKATSGHYYSYQSGSDVSQMLRDYAEKVINWTEKN